MARPNKTGIILALNVDYDKAIAIRDTLGSRVDMYKIGIDLFTRHGPEVVRQFTGAGFPVFLDLKFADIPSVVGKAVKSAAALGADMVTVHTMAGPDVLKEAVAAVPSSGKPLIIAVTVLTSLDEARLAAVTGSRNPVIDRVAALAKMAHDCGCHGVVASPQEVAMIRQTCGPDLLIVTPGIRMEPATAADDQARTMTPAEAAAAGADYIVIGRPVFTAPDPCRMITEIRKTLDQHPVSWPEEQPSSPLAAILEEYGVLRKGHFLLTSGRHSDRYFEKFRILEHPQLCERFARLLAAHFRDQGITVVCGPTTGGAIIAYEIARLLNARSCIAEPAHPGRKIGRGFKLGPDDRVLVVDDVMTTGGSLLETIAAVSQYPAAVVGAGVFIDRSPGVSLPVPFFAAHRQEVVTYSPEQCPLCGSGEPLEEPHHRSSRPASR